MNLAGSHDTNRVRFLLKKINNDNDAAALQRMKEWQLFSFTCAGSPTLYYGDEIALSHDGVWTGKWEDDPYNRAPYPWPDTTGSAYVPVTDMLAFVRKMASIRWSYSALQTGDVQHGLVIDDANKLYGFARTTGNQTALIVLNRDSVQHTVNLTGLNDGLGLDCDPAPAGYGQRERLLADNNPCRAFGSLQNKTSYFDWHSK